jgi:hypothetical protein
MDITAGEELTIPYTNSGFDFQQRNEQLLQHSGFKCSCSLCKQGHLGPSGELREMVLRIVDNGIPNTPPALKEIEAAVEKLMGSGFGLDRYPMRSFHLLLLGGYIKQRKYEQVLKACLTLYYFIEPSQTPPTSREERLETLHYMIQLFDWWQADNSSPTPVQMTKQKLYFHLRHKFVRETETCYGPDSAVGKYERENFDMAVRTLKSVTGLDFVALADSKLERDLFFVAMNQLLKKTANLPARAEKELF